MNNFNLYDQYILIAKISLKYNDNSIITREEDNNLGAENAYFPKNKPVL
jgi:hypothetical protein